MASAEMLAFRIVDQSFDSYHRSLTHLNQWAFAHVLYSSRRCRQNERKLEFGRYIIRRMGALPTSNNPVAPSASG